MTNLHQYLLLENYAEEISRWLDSIRDVTDAMDSLKRSGLLDSGDDRYLNMVLNKLSNDPDIVNYWDDPYQNVNKLRRILLAKLNPRELKYIDEIVNKIADLADSNADIINNIIISLIDDPDIEKWAKYQGTEFKLRQILKQKLNPSQMRYQDQICDKLIELSEKADHRIKKRR